MKADMKKLVSVLVTLAAALVAAAQVPEGDGRRWAVVDLSVNFMREAPDYTAENGDQALMGTVVEIIGEDSYWRKIVSPEPYTAWATELGLKEMDAAQANAYIAAPKYICTADITYIHSEPSAKSSKVSDMVMGGLVRTVSDSRGRPVKKGRFLACRLPSGRQGWVLKTDVEDFRAWTDSRRPSGENIVETALRFLGVPYMWGGTSIKEVDCSGLTRCAFFMNGILLPRNASQQARTGIEASLDALEPGDLLFFGTQATDDKPARVNHVGIYIGEGRFIHSSHYVRISSLDPASPDYYERKPLLARRIIGHQNDGQGVVDLIDSRYYFLQSK
jgi:hypothetical protein